MVLSSEVKEDLRKRFGISVSARDARHYLGTGLKVDTTGCGAQASAACLSSLLAPFPEVSPAGLWWELWPLDLRASMLHEVR